jgi:ACS family tartrate transporter-like MFS transporter
MRHAQITTMSFIRTSSPEEHSVLRKTAWRLIPFLCLLYFIAFLDRVNVGFAALTMNQDIGLSASAYGIGAGIFFLGYFFFEVPSNLLLKRFGARRWIARIMVSWGIVSMAMACVQGPVSFWILRFLLGVAEAGFFPGMILYLTYWFPNRVRGAMVGYFLLANPLTSVLGAPLSTALLGSELFGLAGWQTMFIIEGIPAILLGIVVLFYLHDSPAEAKWLNADEKRVLISAIEREQQFAQHASLREGLTSRSVWLFGAIYFGMNLGVYGFGFFAPQIIKALGNFSVTQTGFVTAIPYACAALAMFLWGRHSDATGERVWHFSLAALMGACAFTIGSYSTNVYIAIAAFSLGAMGVLGAMPVFWTMPTALLTGTAAAGGIALINSIGTLSGYFGPVLMGKLKESTGSYTAGLTLIAVAMSLSALLVLSTVRKTFTKRSGSTS